MIACAPDEVPPGPCEYDGLIVGWGAYMHIPAGHRRISFLQALRRRAFPGSPVLLSFFTRGGSSRYEALVYRTACVCRFLTLQRGAGPGLGDDINWGRYCHSFTREEIDAELRSAGFKLAHFSDVTHGHAVGIAE